MTFYAAPEVSALERARSYHSELVTRLGYSHADAKAAEVPLLWQVIGEHTDCVGGIVVMAATDRKVAAAVTPTNVPGITFEVHLGDTTISGEVSQAEWQHWLSHQDIKLDEPRTADSANASGAVDSSTDVSSEERESNNWAQILGALTGQLIQRQLLSRSTVGLVATLVSDVPAHLGLSTSPALESAYALAARTEPAQEDDVPMRTKLAGVAAHAAAIAAVHPPIRANYQFHLRDHQGVAAVMDYADESLLTTIYPLDRRVKAFAIAMPESEAARAAGITGQESSGAEAAGQELARREAFAQLVARSFGVSELLRLPHVDTRVSKWLEAWTEFHGAAGVPTPDEAHDWVSFWQGEVEHTKEYAAALRSRKLPAALLQLAASQTALDQEYHLLGSAQALGEFALSKGAVVARAACAGVSQAVIAYVPAEAARDFAEECLSIGLDVVALNRPTS